MKKKLRIYIDTSVIGGCCDDEFSEWSNKLVEEFKIGRYVPVISELTEAELSKAPQKVQDVLIELLNNKCAVLVETEESIELAQKHVEAKILTANLEDGRLKA